MTDTFSSVFAADIDNYLKLLSNVGRKTAGIKSALRSLDKYLVSVNHCQKALTPQIIYGWQKDRTVSTSTMALYTSSVIGFERYLASFGIEVYYPERPKPSSTYMPYIFSDCELERIFAVADSIKCSSRTRHQAIMFPVLLRILYGCGLRSGEGISLRWKDVDLERGVLTIRKAKNLRERFVPMSASLTEILRIYYKLVQQENICNDYIF